MLVTPARAGSGFGPMQRSLDAMPCSCGRRAERRIGRGFSVRQCLFAVRLSHTNLQRPSFPLRPRHSFPLCRLAGAIQSLLVGGSDRRGKSTKGPTHAFAWLTLIWFCPPPLFPLPPSPPSPPHHPCRLKIIVSCRRLNCCRVNHDPEEDPDEEDPDDAPGDEKLTQSGTLAPEICCSSLI